MVLHLFYIQAQGFNKAQRNGVKLNFDQASFHTSHKGKGIHKQQYRFIRQNLAAEKNNTIYSKNIK